MNSTMVQNKTNISISVRNLVEFIFRAGDIDSGYSPNRMADGARLHRKIQKCQEGKYKAEVWLKYTIEKDCYVLNIEGRADGIIEYDDGSYCIDEIKTVSVPLEQVDNEYSFLHWAQVICYASIFAIEKNLPEVEIRLTYCHQKTEQIKYLKKTLTICQLKTFIEDLIGRYHDWAMMSASWAKKRDESLREMQFPFLMYRKGQRELAVEVYKTVRDGRRLFVKAPTGIGKTISTLFPAMKAIGQGCTSKIFYLTAKTITRSVVEETLEILRKNGLSFKTATLTAKDKICCNHVRRCNPIDCQLAKGHFDRINSALLEMLNNYDTFTMEIISQNADKYHVCPFELTLDLTLWSDAIICDYNYVFDPHVYLKRFFADGGGKYTFLIDEAHNLVDRSRDMFSAEICKSQLLTIKKAFMKVDKGLASRLNTCNSIMIAYRKRYEIEGVIIEKQIQSTLISKLRKLIDYCNELLAVQKIVLDDDCLQIYFDIVAFVKISEFYDERYVTYIEKKDSDVKVKMFCIDPSFLLQEALKRCNAAVFFSATLFPVHYFRQILGGESDDKFLTFDSPFEKENRCIIVARDISVKFVNRESNSMKIVECIKSVVNSQLGNYLVFFPSHHYMKQIYELATTVLYTASLHIQSNSMTEREREFFLQNFQSNPMKTTIGFCVLGGIFSEGIDLKKDRLIGSLIVGVGLPQVCLERDIIKAHFHEQINLGFEYAYTYPGMNKVLQAAGRVIRSETDRGVIVLIDDRFSCQKYTKLFPQDWFPYKKVYTNEICKTVSNFWKMRK